MSKRGAKKKMKASELIKTLEMAIEKHRDLEVRVYDKRGGLNYAKEYLL
jgi:hypothetical protein